MATTPHASGITLQELFLLSPWVSGVAFHGLVVSTDVVIYVPSTSWLFPVYDVLFCARFTLIQCILKLLKSVAGVMADLIIRMLKLLQH